MMTTVPSTSTAIPADNKGVAGSGLATSQAEKTPVLLSPALKEVVQSIVSKYAADKTILTPTEFQAFLKQEQDTSEAPFEGPVSVDKLEEYLLSPANAPTKVPELDLSHPLKDYLISSSHNTYLVGNQLYGDASVEGYKTVLLKGCRCIEIDCWDGHDKEPKVVHGFTAVEPVSFRVVCNAIAKYAFVTSDLPVIISLEVHCSLEQQHAMVDIIHEEFGDLLLKSKVEGVDLDTLPPPLHLKKKILLKTKYLPPEGDESLKRERSTVYTSSESEEEPDSKDHSHRRPRPPKVKTLRSLSNLGVYTASTHFRSFSNPLSKLFNHIHSFSERRFKKLLESDADELRQHNAQYLTRVYPFGLRFSSSNQEPAVFWRNGAQLVALNWQKFDLGMMQNEALFNGSGGMILKPDYIHSGKPKGMYLTIHIIGATGLPCPEGLKDISKLNPYVKVELRTGITLKKEIKPKKKAGASVIWNGTLAFNRVEDNLSFVRFLVYHDEIGRDDLFAVYTARLDSLQQGYRFLRLLDVEGNEIPGAVLMVHVSKK